VERALGKVRFARLIHSGARDLGGPAVRAAFGGDPSLTWLPLNVIAVKHAGALGMGLIVIGVQASCLARRGHPDAG
jgi:hypothetical protein